MRSLVLAAVVLLGASAGLAQIGPEEDGREVQLWVAGGHSVAGGTKNIGLFNAGLRYGWILTGPHLPGFLRGRFEYALDATPVFLVSQPANTSYGLGFSPLGLKWNFERHGRLSPYFELNGGLLVTNHNVPTGTNDVNFTSAAALGTHILAAKYNWSLEARFLHISNAGLGNYNPGLNTVEIRLGIGRFFGGHRH
jgi:hypothetical protein